MLELLGAGWMIQLGYDSSADVEWRRMTRQVFTLIAAAGVTLSCLALLSLHSLAR